MEKSKFVSNAYVRLLFQYLEKHGIDAVTLLGQEPPEDIDHGRCPMDRWKMLLNRAADYLHDPVLGLHVGETFRISDYGVLGYVLASCPNLGAMLLRTQQYERMFFDVNPMSIDMEGSDLVVRWEGGDRKGSGRHVHECGLVGMVQFARQTSGQRIVMGEISFINPEPPDIRPYVDFFGCPVLFNQPLSAMRIPLSVLNVQLVRPDAILARVLEQQANALLAELPQANEFEMAVRSSIAHLLREGEPDLEKVANTLHVSSRTLRRRLDSNGVNFRALLDDIRHRMAEKYLRDRRLQMSEISQLLGYSEQSAFNRAFRRWTGSTPQNYLRQT